MHRPAKNTLIALREEGRREIANLHTLFFERFVFVVCGTME